VCSCIAEIEQQPDTKAAIVAGINSGSINAPSKPTKTTNLYLYWYIVAKSVLLFVNSVYGQAWPELL
jgi:hypothetical protein